MDLDFIMRTTPKRHNKINITFVVTSVMKRFKVMTDVIYVLYLVNGSVFARWHYTFITQAKQTKKTKLIINIIIALGQTKIVNRKSIYHYTITYLGLDILKY